jgi:inner membrane protein
MLSMDNFSHSVASLLAGEILHRSLPEQDDAQENALRRRLLLTSCTLAGNFPDLDLLLTPLLPAPLGYLLHHRGHTHTVLYALPQALLLAALLWLLWPDARRLLRQSATARIGFLLSLLTGFGLHLLMDYLNFYGLHPFHPFDSKWIYGDMVFIVEPFFWVAFGIPMAMTLQRRALRWTVLAAAPLVLAFFGWRGFLAWQSVAALLAIGLALGALHAMSGARRLAVPLTAVLAGLAFISVQSAASRQAHELVALDLQARDPGAHLLDAAMSPYPANPVCWNFTAVERLPGGDSYRLSRGIVSLAPRMMPVSACPPAFLEGGRLPPVYSLPLALLSRREYSLERLRRLARDDCYFNAWMRFARMPALDENSASDARFAASPRGNFSTLELPGQGRRACEGRVPQWAYPRADLLAAPRAIPVRPGPQN